jgi:hypothetical protein
MGQLLAHLVGDYILQTDRMATKKTSSWAWALFHAIAYGLPFLLLQPSRLAFAVIVLTHAVIDRYRLARFVVAAKNSVTDWDRRGEFFKSPTGYSPEAPAWLATWLLIIADNTLHLCINYGALRWL